MPSDVAALAAASWQLRAASSEWFVPGQWAEVTFENGDAEFIAVVENTSLSGCFIGACTVTGFAASPTAGPAPSLPAGWQPPAAISEDWQAYTLEYGGDRYTLPAPAAAFLQNGWQLLDEATVQPGAWLRGVALQRDGMVLRSMFSNPSASPQPLQSCWVNMVEYRAQGGAAQPLKLAGGLSQASSAEEVQAAWGPPDIIDDTALQNWALTYYSPHGRVVFTFSREDDSLTVLELWNRPPAEA